MKRVLKPLALLAAGGLAAVGPASAQIGGFPTREPGYRTKATLAPGTVLENSLDEVVVSQLPNSKVTTISAAMRLVRPGGTIRLNGGVYNETVNVLKPVAIVGMEDGYGRNAIIRPQTGAACMNISPATPLAAVSVTSVIFEFNHGRAAPACVNVRGGTVAVRNSYIIPSDTDIPIRAAFGPQRPALLPSLDGHIASPPRDDSRQAAKRRRVEQYFRRHAQPVGADNWSWDVYQSGTSISQAVHAKVDASGAGFFAGPAAGVRVTAGDVRLDSNVIIGAQKGVHLVSEDGARIRGEVTNNVLLGNGAGLIAVGKNRGDDLLVTRNTIRFNQGPGVEADVFDGLKILANEIMGNDTGIFLSENVRLATVNSNFIVQNAGDAMTVSTGFFGAVSANTFADNAGCAVEFYSAEQAFLNDAVVELTAFRDFNPQFAYERTNFAVDNLLDAKVPKRLKRSRKRDAYGNRIEPNPLQLVLPACQRSSS